LLGLLLLTRSGLGYSASVEKGRQKFLSNGCWQCHGTWGQGAVTGLRLAPNPKPFTYISAFIRNSNGLMPPYPVSILSEDDLMDIHAYLESIPQSPDPKSLPLLQAF
jgi:mono/diheme cytochrome c family protein